MYPRYEQYQDSGVAWLGEVPSHWEVKRLKFLITELRVGPFGSAIKISDYAESENLLYNQRTVLDNNFFENVISITDEKYVELCSFQVYAGDFLITTRGTIGKVAIVPKNASKGIIHPCLIRFRIDESRILPRLLKIIFNETAFFQDQLKLKSNATTIDVIYSNSLKELILLLPPLPEQTAIAAFLDCKLAQIDALISKQETLLAKLAEKRTALITHAVTRGLNPAAPLKPSGVAWLGEVPQHWEIVKNKFILDFSKGLTITKENLVDDGIPCVNYGEIHSKFGFEVIPERDDLKCVAEDYLQTTPTALLKNGDFVFADTSEDIKGSGNFTYLNSEISTFAGYHTIIARPDRQKVVPRFLAYMFDSDAHRNQVRAMVKGVKVFSVTQAFLKNTFAWLPPLPEQTAIADYLDAQTAQIDALSDKIRQTIARLQEYRRTLITQAVTGKIKVIGEHR